MQFKIKASNNEKAKKSCAKNYPELEKKLKENQKHKNLILITDKAEFVAFVDNPAKIKKLL